MVQSNRQATEVEVICFQNVSFVVGSVAVVAVVASSDLMNTGTDRHLACLHLPVSRILQRAIEYLVSDHNCYEPFADVDACLKNST